MPPQHSFSVTKGQLCQAGAKLDVDERQCFLKDPGQDLVLLLVGSRTQTWLQL